MVQAGSGGRCRPERTEGGEGGSEHAKSPAGVPADIPRVEVRKCGRLDDGQEGYHAHCGEEQEGHGCDGYLRRGCCVCLTLVLLRGGRFEDTD